MDVLDPIPRSNIIRLQIVETPATLRMSRSIFSEWLRATNRPVSIIVDELKTKLGALEHRKAMGGGTKYSGGAAWVLDVPLTGNLAELATGPGRVISSAGPRRSPADAAREAAD